MTDRPGQGGKNKEEEGKVEAMRLLQLGQSLYQVCRSHGSFDTYSSDSSDCVQEVKELEEKMGDSGGSTLAWHKQDLSVYEHGMTYDPPV